MKSFRILIAAFFAACFVAVASFAAGTEAASPAGTWKWTQPGRQGGQGFERKIKLDYKEGKLTGEMLAGEGPMGPTAAAPITDGTFKDGTVAFSVTREFNGTNFTVKYEGKLAGDTITGKSEFPGRDGGEPRKSDWTATRVK